MTRTAVLALCLALALPIPSALAEEQTARYTATGASAVVVSLSGSGPDFTIPFDATTIVVRVEDDLSENVMFHVCIGPGGGPTCFTSGGTLYKGTNERTFHAPAGGSFPAGWEVGVSVFTAGVELDHEAPHVRPAVGTTGNVTVMFS